MAVCNSACASFELTPITSGCELITKKATISRIAFAVCTTDLSEMTCAKYSGLVTANDIVLSNQVADLEWADPDTTAINIADCLAQREDIVGRSLTFSDKLAVTSEVPAVRQDHQFWKKIQEASGSVVAMFLYCDGTLEIPTDANGNPLVANVTVFRSSERQTAGDSQYLMEIKKVTVKWGEDPLKFMPVTVDTTTC